MSKNKTKTKTKKTKDTVSTMYDCCWYDPACYHLCCGDVLLLRRCKWLFEVGNSPREYGIYCLRLKAKLYPTFFNEGADKRRREEGDDSTN